MSSSETAREAAGPITPLPHIPVNDVLKATYADLKTVKTRSTCQVILELPIEALTDVVALLGAPVPGNEVWVAIARLRPEAVKEPAQIEAPADDKPPRPLSQVAAVLGGIVTFRQFLVERTDADILGDEDAARAVRKICGVTSRRELDTNPEAARKFRDLRADYQNWMHGIGEAA